MGDVSGSGNSTPPSMFLVPSDPKLDEYSWFDSTDHLHGGGGRVTSSTFCPFIQRQKMST